MNITIRTFIIELRKEKRTGIIPFMLVVGILGAAYAFVFFLVRKDTLLNLPLAPMDVLLTQLYGMIMVLNMFGIIVAACMIYNMEFKGSAVKKMYMLPMSVPIMYFCKFLILTIMLFIVIVFQNLALITSVPVLSFMIFVSSRFENMWIPLGIGVAGFLSGMALAASNNILLCVHPFVIMLKPAVAMSAQPDIIVVIFSLVETAIFLFSGLWAAKYLRYE